MNAIASLTGAAIAFCLVICLAAVILRAAAKWVLGQDVPFGSAFLTMLLVGIINAVVGFLVGMAIGAVATVNPDTQQFMSYFFAPVGLLIQSAFLSSRLRCTFGQGVLVSLVMVATMLGIVLIAGAAVFGATMIFK